ncbi:MAG: inner membrane protein YbjM [Serratia sp. (in: enterobacteria)]|uniref:inner membrane protein YbjM n=1 Tax=Serratia sp. (in: enterobacteria) TaxID=616 RepID=UPI003F3AC9D8
MVGYRYWVGIFSCFLLFSLVFLVQKSGTVGVTESEHHGETGLLLFILPGFIASYLSSKQRILCPLLGALCAVPLCLIIRHFWLTPGHSFWQELAYAVSAVFWCVLGGMLYLLMRAMIHAWQRFSVRKKN